MDLTQTKPNKKYIITGIEGGSPLCRRLLDMGFTAGSEVFSVASAPFGGTTLVCIRGQLVALRDNAAAAVKLESAP